MPSTPTIVLSVVSNVAIQTVITNPGTNPDHNELWRRTDDEYDGAYVRIYPSVAADGTFTDYAVAFGKTYSYFVRAVDAGGATADSAVSSLSVPSPGAVIVHAIARRDATTNLQTVSSVTIATLLSPPVHQGELSVESEEFQFAGNTVGETRLGQVETGVWTFPITFKHGSNQMPAELTNLEALFDSKQLLCWRTPNGQKLFGTLRAFEPIYKPTVIEISAVFEEMDYSEQV